MDGLFHERPEGQARVGRESRRGARGGNGVPQGSPVAPILFTAYLTGVFNNVEGACPGVQGLSFVDDVAWWAEGSRKRSRGDAE